MRADRATGVSRRGEDGTGAAGGGWGSTRLCGIWRCSTREEGEAPDGDGGAARLAAAQGRGGSEVRCLEWGEGAAKLVAEGAGEALWERRET
ncbi:hypothetical protein MRX96_018244 [Rhipicephalus microplus]